MIRPLRRFALAALVAGLAALPVTVWTQTVLTSTTLSAAITDASATSLVVASATGITAPGTGTNLVFLLIDREVLQVRSVSGTTIGVNRGMNGTRAATHVSGATVWVAPPAAILQYVPSGQCQRTVLSYVPVIVGGGPGLGQEVGSLYDCLGVTTAGQYVQTSPQLGNAVYGSAVASAATIGPTGTMFNVSGTTTINTITVPSGWAQGECLGLNPTGLWATGTSGNIYIASTAVVNKLLFECWDGTKWSPSY